MFNAPSLLRIEENKALSAIRLEGSVLDLGGEKDSDYLKLIGGQFNVLTLNNDPAARACLLYTSDAADDLLCVDLGGRRIIKKKK